MKVVAVVCCLWLAPGSYALEVQKALTASKSWVKAPTDGATTAVAYAVIDNPTMYDVYLTAAESDVAGKVQFAKLSKESSTPETVDALSAPAYDSLELKADGFFLLLRDLKRPLKVGEKIAIYITTDGGASIEVAAEVRPQS